ncbi:hypothetical protein ZIOFF_017087 [Zingiber officinale]|uniref:Uncharacterized protein n=1 Tax=Zingiber officinale TaxID=94328 RepID=A0A8J5H3A1_ZINOF|nr:hypothetical protein ZIOFF_017087 [Zingiber officinale]
MASTSNQELVFTYSQQGIPIFVGQDFELWNVLMRTVFVSHELWDVIDEGYIAHTQEEVAAFTNAQKKEHKENKTKDAKALSFMHQGVSRSILPRITSAKTANEAWQILKNQFGGHEKVITIKLQNLWRDFDNLGMKDSENVQDFLSRVLTVINQIRGYGDTLEEKKIIEKVLRCLPVKFEHIVAAIEESKDLSKLSLDELMGSLEAHEKRMNRFSTQTLEQAFQGKMNVSQKAKDSPQEKKNISAQRASQGRGRGRFQNSNTRGQGRGGRGNSSSRFKNQDSDSYCRICRRNGHDTQSCWNRCKRCRNTNHSKKDGWFQDEDETKEANFFEKNEADQLDDGAAKVDAKIYRSLVGSLIYLTNTRPDIVYSVSLISRFMHEPSKLHYAAAKRILRYLQGTRKLGIKYVKEKENKLVGYTDSDWAGSLDDRKSTSGYIFCLGSKIISWVSKKQKTVSLSSAEAEYIAATDAACEAVWLRRILSDVEQKQEAPTTIFCDNNSTIAMTKNPVFHARTKHIELRHHFIRDLVSDKKIQLKFINTNEQLADDFTKAVSSGKIEQLRNHVRIT